MNKQRLCQLSQVESPATIHRRGLVALTEVLVVITAATSLLWIGSRMLAMDARALPKGLTRACSERGVYRIAIEDDQRKLWIYRPREGIVSLNLATRRVEATRSLFGIGVCAMGSSGDGKCLLVCGVNNTVLWYRGADEPQMLRHANSDEWSIDASVSHDGGLAVCITPSGIIHGWRSMQGQMHEFSYELVSTPSIVRMVLSHSGRRMAIVRADGAITFYHPESGIRELSELQSGSDGLMLAWSSDDKLLVTSAGGKLRIYDSESLHAVWEPENLSDVPRGAPTAVEISPNGRWIAAGCNTSNDILIYDREVPGHPIPLKGHDGIVRTIRFSADSKLLYTGSYDGTIREWSCDQWGRSRVID